MLTLNIQVNDQSVTKLFDQLEKALDTTGILDEAGALVLNRIRTRFLHQVDPEGAAWVPSLAGLKRRGGGYTYRHGHRYTATGTLFETGALFHSIQLLDAGPFHRNIATDIPYAHYLQEGTSKMPPRIFLGVGEDDATAVERLLLLRLKRFLSEVHEK